MPPATSAASVYGLPRVGFFIFFRIYFFLRQFGNDRSEIWPQCVDSARRRVFIFRVYISRICRENPIRPIFTKNWVFQLAQDVITPSKFDRQILTRCWFAGVQSLGPPIYSVHWSYKQSPSIAGASDYNLFKWQRGYSQLLLAAAAARNVGGANL